MATKGPPRGQVTEEERACLENNRVFLLGEVDCSSLIPLLRTQGILDADDEIKIKASARRSEQNGCLLDILLTRTPKGFQAFLQALDETGHEKAASTLRGTLPGGQLQTSMAKAPGADNVSEVEDLRKQLQEASAVIEQLKSENVSMSEKLTLADIAEKKIEKLTQEVGSLTRENTKLSKALDAARQELADVKKESSAQKKEFEAYRAVSENTMLMVVSMFDNLQTQLRQMERQLGQNNMYVAGRKAPFAKRR